MDAKQYEKYVKEKTPTHNLFLNMLGAFVSGGAICTLGQVILNVCKNMGQGNQRQLDFFDFGFAQCHSHRL